MQLKKRIAIVQGHPDTGGSHFGHALAEAYAQAAREAGHEIRLLHVAKLDFPLLRSAEDWKSGTLPAAVREAQETITRSSHVVIVFPLWLGDMPALLKGFFEQVMRPGFAFSGVSSGKMWKKGLKGRSARVVVTMGMPAAVYRWYFRAHSLKSLQRNILGFVGIAPVRATLIGSVETSASGRAKSIKDMRRLGSAGQ
jgi:putative NADPH-quinone reductase